MANSTEHFTFNVEEKAHNTRNWIKYKDFIEKLRSRLGATCSHGRPVLPPRQNPRQWFDIELQTNTRSITLRISRDDLYVAGYRMENSDQWWEFGSNRGTTNNPSEQLIPGSSFLGFNCSYDALENAAGRYRDGISLGQTQLTTAVNALATSTDPRSGDERAQSLIIVIQMICESIRFIWISDHLATTVSGLKPPPRMLQLENKWGTLSKSLLNIDHDPHSSFTPLPPLQNNPMENETTKDDAIESIEDFVKIVGILKFYEFKGKPSGQGSHAHDEL